MHGDKCDIGIKPYFNQIRDEQRLFGSELQHLTASQIKARLGDDPAFGEYFKFSIVRNPWERLVSTCAWSDQKWAKGEPLERAQFDQVVRQLHALFTTAKRAGRTAHISPQVLPQCEFIFDQEQRSMVDFIARYENLEQDWQVVCARLDIDVALPTRMRSHHQPYRAYYSDETRAMVAEVYARDAELFGYGF